MLTGSAGKPQGTTRSTQMAVGRSSPSRCIVISEVRAAGGHGGPFVQCPRGPAPACVSGLEQDGGSRCVGGASPKSPPPPPQRTEHGPSSGTTVTMPRG